MHITIINDCSDPNAEGRQVSRVGVLAKEASVSFVGVESYGDLSAGGNLIDILDAMGGKKGAVLVNVAPRHKGSHIGGSVWPNGTPFCYFKYKETVIVATIDGLTLSLVKKLELVNEVHLMDVAVVAQDMKQKGLITEEEAHYLPLSQFRSFDFSPRVAVALLEGYIPPSEPYSITQIPQAPKEVWWIDNFGNAKTTLLPEEISFTVGGKAETALGTFTCYEQLAHVPKDEVGLTIGSSGLGGKRFVELVIQGGRASDQLGLMVGDLLESEPRIEEETGEK